MEYAARHYAPYSKKADPTWYPTKKIKDFKEKDGVFFTDVVGPGPENPLGKYALYTTMPAYLIHGTNELSGIGMRTSSGCVRLFPEDIERLFKVINLGERVTIINQPYKIGWREGHLFLEAHAPWTKIFRGQTTPSETWIRQKIEPLLPPKLAIDWSKVLEIAKEAKGYPVQID